MSSPAGVPFQPFSSLAEAFDGPRSVFFGVPPGGQSKRPESYYSTKTPYLGFDISNNQILCSINATGLLENTCILADLMPAGLNNLSCPGAYVEKDLIGSSPWPLAIQREGGEPVNLHELPGAGAELLGNLFPLFTYQWDALRIRLLAFAPTAAVPTLVSPRAVLVVLHVENHDDQPFQGAVLAPKGITDLSRVSAAPGVSACREAVTCLDDTRWTPDLLEIGFALRPAEQAVFCLAFILGESGEELHRTGRLLRERTVLSWLNETWQFHASRLGQLSIPDEPYYAESLVRFEELCRQSTMRMADGKFGAGFWGSDFVGVSAWQSTLIWMKDNFHAMLPMSMFEPQLCRDAILFFLRWGLPIAPHGALISRFPHPRRVTHSLSNALSALALAGAYYQMSDDRAFFLEHPEILEEAYLLLEDVLKSRQGEPFLFPSAYVSDIAARGDFHTGSNLLAWYSFHHMARIAREVYNDQELADKWSEIAAKVKADIWQYCVGDCSLGRRFFEGANADGTFVACHDGEETDTTLMPFYGFCEPDDPALVNHARLALSPENPYYASDVDGIWSERIGATFPGWMTALAGVSTQDEMRGRLEQIRRLTDHDGSIWWWPYKYLWTDPTKVRRRDPGYDIPIGRRTYSFWPGKCGWAAGVYLCMFVNNILGLRVDVPARQVSLRPFCPWPEFAWQNCRLGRSLFDFAYEHRKGRIVGRITNRNECAFDGAIELTLPDGAAAAACMINGATTDRAEHTRRYNRAAVRAEAPVAPGEEFHFEVRFR